jgi:MFS family permease
VDSDLGPLRARLRESLAAFRAAARNPDVQRLQLAFAVSSTGQWAQSIAVTVFSFEAGGPGAVGLQLVLRMVPAALAAPFAGTLADRYPRRRIMVVSDLLRVAIVCAMAALVVVEAPYVLVLVASGLSGVVGTAFEPAKAALLPSLAREPDELTAANVVSSTIDSASLLAGPALGALLLAATSVEVVLGVTALGLCWSALIVSGIRGGGGVSADKAGAPRRGLVAETVDGARAVVGHPAIRLLVALAAAQLAVDGALGVLQVAAALDLLDMGRPGLGVLTAASGAGGLVGAALALGLVGRGRLAPSLALGMFLWGLPLVA